MARAVNWLSVETAYRSGLQSLRKMGVEFGVSEGTIRRRAKQYGWVRDGSMVKREQVKAHFAGKPAPEVANQPEAVAKAIDEAAIEVHGITLEFLKDKPHFDDIVDELTDYLKGAELVIHNAAFDMKFLNFELAKAGLAQIPMDQALDTLAIARRKFPGSPASLDALCRRFGIDNTSRTLHGALLDSEILAEVYLELIGGRQPDFGLAGSQQSSGGAADTDWRPQPRPTSLPPRLTANEKTAHDAFVNTLGDAPLWNKLRA